MKTIIRYFTAFLIWFVWLIMILGVALPFWALGFIFNGHKDIHSRHFISKYIKFMTDKCDSITEKLDK